MKAARVVIVALGLFATIAWAAEAGKVTRVVDGDTIEVKIGRTSETVRLIGVNTPGAPTPSTA